MQRGARWRRRTSASPRRGRSSTRRSRFAELCDDYLRVPEHDLARVRERYVSALAERGALDFGGLQREAVALLERDAETRRTLPERVPLHPRRRVPGHERRPGAAARAARRRAPQRLLRRRRGSVDLRLPRRRDRATRSASTSAGRARAATTCRSTTAPPPPIVELATSVIRRNVDTHLGKELRAGQERPAELVGRTFRHAAEEADWIAREIAALRLEGVAARARSRCSPARSRRSARGSRTRCARTRSRSTRRSRRSCTRRADALLSLLELAAAYPWEAAHDDAALRVLASPLFGADPLELRALSPRAADALRRAARLGRLRAVLRGAGDRQASADRGRRDLRALGAARPLPRARRSAGRDARAGRGARRRDRALRRRERVRRRAGRVPDAPSARASSTREDWLPAAPPPADAVALLTVHQAKGLEWDAVFVCDLVEGRFPALARSQYALFDREASRRRAARRGRARPPRARGGAAPLLRRADARAHAALPDGDGGAARGVRPLALALLPRGAAVSRARAASASELVSADGGARRAAARRRRPARLARPRRDDQRERDAARRPASGRPPRASRRTRTARSSSSSAACSRSAAPARPRCGSAASSTTCSRPSTIPSATSRRRSSGCSSSPTSSRSRT